MLNRRAFIVSGAAALGAAAMRGSTQAAVAATPRREIIDCHTHFYDPSRPQGVPWPKQGTTLYRTVLPRHYRALAEPLGVTGTVVVEASVWLEDNQWILDLAEDEPFIVGFVGNLSSEERPFAESLKRFSKRPLFRGIRVNGNALAQRIGDAAYIDNMRRLAGADLSLDVNGSASMLVPIARLAVAVPDLRIVIDHVGGPRRMAEWQAGIAAAAEHPNVYCKVSGLPEQNGSPEGQAPTDVAHYAPILDAVWRLFGEDRLIYGTNWPVSDRGAPLAAVHKLATDFITPKGEPAITKFFAGNARRVYKWVKRR